MWVGGQGVGSGGRSVGKLEGLEFQTRWQATAVMLGREEGVSRHFRVFYFVFFKSTEVGRLGSNLAAKVVIVS